MAVVGRRGEALKAGGLQDDDGMVIAQQRNG
jgi:hypothetical protein